MTPRSSGILLHPTSLPGRFGVGDLGREADRFLDWMVEAGQRVWQVLPLGPPGHGHTPYTALSSFAGDPRLIAPELLAEEGLVSQSHLDTAPHFPAGRVEFAGAVRFKKEVLREAWRRLRSGAATRLRDRFEAFAEDRSRCFWLEDWALYSSLKARYAGSEWTAWESDLVRRDPEAMAAARHELSEEVAYHRFHQFLFFEQWNRVRSEAHARGIRILGDLPIYVAEDSADVWSRAELFDLDDAGRPRHVAGVPPDYFSKTGQLWGNPIYRWDRLEAEGFAWWIERMRANLALADFVRLDHFRAFASYWEVPATETTAIHGRWVPGPGAKLLAAMRGALGALPLVAEDLGTITEDVHALREAFGLPGMKVLQFGFDEDDSSHHPSRHESAYVVYTGTHDNDTTRGWFGKLGAEARARVLDHVGGDGDDIAWRMIEAALLSSARLSVIPMQDVLDLGSEARMNTPGSTSGNWAWRMRSGAADRESAERLRVLTERAGRAVR